MICFQDEITVETEGRALQNITSRIAEVVGASGVSTGLCTVFVRHTSASLIIQENADPAVLRDLARWMAKVAPEGRDWEHDAEGPDDMPAHARSAITKTSEQIPITKGRLALGTWQGVYLWEHRSRPHRRRVLVHVQGGE
jgi:secondary thiamine-phosphate synthase enzyme